ncbi:ssDNA endodeoxyribonuclease [Blomia tropicalis]|nr:ssDNA endodeoxyribonuclease [Blomia tropicalis]
MNTTGRDSFSLTQNDTISSINGVGNTSRPKQYMFSGEIGNVQSLIPILNSICIKQKAVLLITEKGLKITCEEDSHAVQANAFIDRNIFYKYNLNNNIPQSLCFKMSDLLATLSALLSSSNNEQVSGSHSSSRLQIKYETADRLKLQLINESRSAMAYIHTYHPPKLIVFSMSFVNKIILDASVLIDFWRSSDKLSRYLHIKMGNDEEPFFELATESSRGQFVTKVAAHSSHVEHYECTVPVSCRYEMSMMHFTVRPLLFATKISILMDSSNLMQIQYLIRLDNVKNKTRQSDRNNRNLFIDSSTSQQVVSISQEVQKLI